MTNRCAGLDLEATAAAGEALGDAVGGRRLRFRLVYLLITIFEEIVNSQLSVGW